MRFSKIKLILKFFGVKFEQRLNQESDAIFKINDPSNFDLSPFEISKLVKFFSPFIYLLAKSQSYVCTGRGHEICLQRARNVVSPTLSPLTTSNADFLSDRLTMLHSFVTVVEGWARVSNTRNHKNMRKSHTARGRLHMAKWYAGVFKNLS